MGRAVRERIERLRVQHAVLLGMRHDSRRLLHGGQQNVQVIIRSWYTPPPSPCLLPRALERGGRGGSAVHIWYFVHDAVVFDSPRPHRESP